MRTALFALVLVLSLAACGKKKAPASPSNATDTQAAPTEDEKADEEKSVTTPDENEEGANSSDPCEGGE